MANVPGWTTTPQPFPVDNDSFPSVSITEGEISAEPGTGDYVDDGAGDLGIWTDYRIVNHYEKDGHIYMMGITSPGGFNGQSVAFCQLASPTLLWISRWTAMRANTQPDIPDPTPQDPNWILLDDMYDPDQVVTGPDGSTPLYRISGTFVYGHKNPNPQTIRNINFARPPWLQDVFDRSVPSSKLKQNLINTTRQFGQTIQKQPGQ